MFSINLGSFCQSWPIKVKIFLNFFIENGLNFILLDRAVPQYFECKGLAETGAPAWGGAEGRRHKAWAGRTYDICVEVWNQEVPRGASPGAEHKAQAAHRAGGPGGVHENVLRGTPRNRSTTR